MIEALEVGEARYRLFAVTPVVRVHALNGHSVRRDRRVVDDAHALIRRIELSGMEPAQVPTAYYRTVGQPLRVRQELHRLDRESLRRVERSDMDANRSTSNALACRLCSSAAAARGVHVNAAAFVAAVQPHTERAGGFLSG